MTLLRKLESFLQRHAADAEAIVVAISGGPDSVALLLALRGLLPQARLVAAHLNHCLRGAESDADEAFVQELSKKLGVECRTDRREVRAQAEGGNLEETARRIRYDWLQKIAEEHGLRWLATGHTADDQAETVLHRLLRGTGLRGLRGIAPIRSLQSPRASEASPRGITLIRPLLHVARSEVLEFLESRQQDFRSDGTNLDLTFTRNRIRHELLPLLAKNCNPEIARVLAQLAEQAEEAYGIIEAKAGQVLAEIELPRAGNLLIFERHRLAEVPRELVRELFRLVWVREGWPMGDIDFDAWNRLAGVAAGELQAVDLPGGITARLRERVVQLGPAS
jgi:tRNA(Ile)-lysidine synthase